MRPTLDHPAVWRGSDLAKRPDWQQGLDPETIAEARAAFHAVEDSVGSGAPTLFESPRLKAFAERLRLILEDGAGATLVTGFLSEESSARERESFFWTLCSYLGHPLSQSAEGERIYRVRDAGFKMGHSKARGPNTRKALSFHTDRCDVISFFCVRPAKVGGINFIASSMAIHNEIQRRRPDLLELLYQPFHYQRHNIDHGNSWPFCKQPIFSIFQGHFAANILRVLIERAHSCPEIPDLTKDQREALDLVQSIAAEDDFHLEFRLQPGEMLFLNNFVVLHSRTEFEDWDDVAKRRELLRIWLSMPNSRPLSPEFQSHYGSTEAGAIRGGIHPRKV